MGEQMDRISGGVHHLQILSIFRHIHQPELHTADRRRQMSTAAVLLISLS